MLKDQSRPDLIREQRRALSFLNRLPRARDEATVNVNERTIIDRLSKAASNALTDAMGGTSERYSLLALVPGRALFQELGKNLPSANAYLRTNEDMDALRNEWHATTDKVTQAWQKAIVETSGATLLTRGRAKAAAKALADLMHDATTAGLDPAERFEAPRRQPDMHDEDYARYVDEMRRRYTELRERWTALPEPLQQTYRTVRDTGKFTGLTPPSIAERTGWFAAEKDRTTAAIAQRLYQRFRPVMSKDPGLGAAAPPQGKEREGEGVR